MNEQALLDEYFITELKVPRQQAIMMIEKIRRYDDIYNEFYYWLNNRNYEKEEPLVVEGYTAKQIHELNPRFEGIGVYNFMITLREHPERAKRYINDGFIDL